MVAKKNEGRALVCHATCVFIVAIAWGLIIYIFSLPFYVGVVGGFIFAFLSALYCNEMYGLILRIKK